MPGSRIDLPFSLPPLRLVHEFRQFPKWSPFDGV